MVLCSYCLESSHSMPLSHRGWMMIVRTGSQWIWPRFEGFNDFMSTMFRFEPPCVSWGLINNGHVGTLVLSTKVYVHQQDGRNPTEWLRYNLLCSMILLLIWLDSLMSPFRKHYPVTAKGYVPFWKINDLVPWAQQELTGRYYVTVPWTAQ